MDRPQYYRFHQGQKQLPFADSEYETRLKILRQTMHETGVDACVLTSMHNVSYYSGFLYCSFGRPYAQVVTKTDTVTCSAGIDAAQPWRRCYGDNITYTDWQRHNYWQAILSVTGTGKTIGFEGDHISISQMQLLDNFLEPNQKIDIAPAIMKQRMHKSTAELALIRAGAATADVGGYAIRDQIKSGAREIDIAMAGRDAMELDIAKRYPDAEYRDSWVWFQSGINTDGAHNPVTARKLESGDILSLNTFPMISGYYTALERTLFVNEVDDASLKAWEANVKVHERGLELIKPGVKCSEICEELNNLFADLGYLQYRTFGYGHSFGMLSHFYGREAGLELREDIDTVLEKNMVISMEPMIMIPEGKPGAGGYREHDILVIKEDGAENITRFPFGPSHNVIKN